METKLNIVELFAGSREISKQAEDMGFNSFSCDIQDFPGIDRVGDILDMTIEDVPFIPSIVWASFDCTTYSIAAISKHRDGTDPKSDYAKTCDAVNIHSISLIKQWLEINPNLKFFIENPRGMLRKMPFMQDFERVTVWYCKYGDERAKPTDIWHNSKSWTPRPVCWNYKYDKQGKIIDRHCHHSSARRGAKTGTQGRKGSFERSLIPPQLIEDILTSIIEDAES